MVVELLQRSERITKISIGVLVSFGLVLFFTGTLSGSIALRGDGIHTLADAMVAGIVLFGLRMLRRKPTEKFQFGYYKIENLASMLLSMFLVLVGAWIFYQSYLSFINPEPLAYPLAGLVVALVAAVAFYTMAWFKWRNAKKFDLLSLKTEAKNSVKTGVASTVVFVGLAFSYLGFYQVEAIAGMAIATFIFVITYAALRESSMVLLDGCACTGTRGDIKILARSVEGVDRVHNVLLRKSGPYVVGELHIGVDGSLSVSEANRIVKRVERTIKRRIPIVKRLTIKVDPARRKN